MIKVSRNFLQGLKIKDGVFSERKNVYFFYRLSKSIFNIIELNMVLVFYVNNYSKISMQRIKT
jgi:hypothetical protein